MSDSESRPDKPSVPSWQRAQPEESEPTAAASSPTATATETETETEAQTQAEVETQPETEVTASVPEEDSLEVARKFLDDEAVRDAPWDKKVAFLKTKGIDDVGIQTLLGDEPTPTASEVRS